MIGITGTNGKTTTSQLVAQLARSLGNSCGVIGTLGASLDETVCSATNTTPDPVSCPGDPTHGFIPFEAAGSTTPRDGG